MLRCFATAICAGLLSVGGASAAHGATVTVANIVSPSKLITCHALAHGGPGIECSADYLPRIGMFDPYLGLRPRGNAKAGERSDFPGYSSPRRTLRYGDVWKRRGTSCTMHAARGLRCTNLDGHGFVLVRGGIRRF